jgi:hypothetical protein
MLIIWCSCSGLVILLCDLFGSACSLVEFCTEGCFNTGHGPSCVNSADKGSPKMSSVKLRRQPDLAAVSVDQGNCDGVPGKCRQCTDTHRGVYTCQGGFCAVEPGDWCKGSWSCHDDCNCCKRDRKRSIVDMKSSEKALKVRSIVKRESVGPAQVLDAPYGPLPSN